MNAAANAAQPAGSRVCRSAAVLREGFTDVSFLIGGSRGWKAIMLALVFPIAVGLISYGGRSAESQLQRHHIIQNRL
jgi:hypothetical protein